MIFGRVKPLDAILATAEKKSLHRSLGAFQLTLFGIGYSWGGYESLIIPVKYINSVRTATKWTHDGTLIRNHVGLEDIDDLIADLEAGFKRLKG